MASILSTVLILAVSILLFTHVFMVFASMCSVEAGILMSFNPFSEAPGDPTDTTKSWFSKTLSWENLK